MELHHDPNKTIELQMIRGLVMQASFAGLGSRGRSKMIDSAMKRMGVPAQGRGVALQWIQQYETQSGAAMKMEPPFQINEIEAAGSKNAGSDWSRGAHA